MNASSNVMKDLAWLAQFKLNNLVSVERRILRSIVEAKREAVARFVVLISIVENINVKNDATKANVLHAQENLSA